MGWERRRRHLRQTWEPAGGGWGWFLKELRVRPEGIGHTPMRERLPQGGGRLSQGTVSIRRVQGSFGNPGPNSSDNAICRLVSIHPQVPSSMPASAIEAGKAISFPHPLWSYRGTGGPPR